MLKKNFKIKDSIDVYVADTESQDKVLLTFHRMTTRERVEIIASRQVAEFVALLDGRMAVDEALSKLGAFDCNQAENFISYLLSRRLIVAVEGSENFDSRYKRQISFFDDMIPVRSGVETQNILHGKKVVILGCGAVGSAIAETLTRLGIFKFVLVDYKLVEESHILRHLFVCREDLGKRKVDVLSNYLRRIDPRVSIYSFHSMLRPTTDLSEWVDDDVDLIVNTCDEPYIGHTSLKVGRYAHERGIPVYVAGGFDAHLMSSGELLDPPNTPCIDCAQNTFNLALKNWNPVYSSVASKINGLTKAYSSDDSNSDHCHIGGSGGLAMMSGFSVFLGCLEMIRFLSEDSSYERRAVRREYLPNSGEVTEFQMKKQGGCHVCNR